MVQLLQGGSRRAASWLVGIGGILGLVVIALATVRAMGVQKELDQRISTLQGELATWRYYTMRSEELATKQALLRAKLGEQGTTAAERELAPCLGVAAAAAAIPPVPSGLEWNPMRVRRAIRERQAWCTSAQQVIASAIGCVSISALLEQAIESLDRELAQPAMPGPG